MELISQPHSMAALLLGRGSSDNTEQEGRWVPEPIRMLWEEEISCPYGESIPDSPVIWPVT
jgi:hypothetical protein